MIKIYLAALLGLLISIQSGAQSDIIERDYFPRARAKNAAIAAARYAEEGYFYIKFTTDISAVTNSRLFSDTALFFIKRSLMLADTSLFYAPKVNFPAIDFLKSGVQKSHSADSIIRAFYPMTELSSHQIFGNEAALQLSNAVMELFNASLLLHPEKDAPLTEDNRYELLPYKDEILRLEADETAFQHVSNQLEAETKQLDKLVQNVLQKLDGADDQKSRALFRERLQTLEIQLKESTLRLRVTSAQLQQLRSLLNQKYLDDVRFVEEPDHMAHFETAANGNNEIAMNETVPDGLVYKIQLGYYPAKENLDNFHGLFPISGETVSKDLTRYYAGLFFSYHSASQGNDYIKNNAVENSFIVPYYNGAKISSSWAIELERTKGIK